MGIGIRPSGAVAHDAEGRPQLAGRNSASWTGAGWRPQMANADDAPQRDGSGNYILPPDTDWSKILDAALGGGWDVGTNITRDSAITCAAMLRAVTLISATLAQLITGGGLMVVGPDGKRKDTRRVRRTLELLSSSVDDGQTASYSFFEDAIADYCLDGNAILEPFFDGDGTLMSLRRMSPWDSEAHYTRDGEMVYRLTTIDDTIKTVWRSSRDVIHARFPRLQRYSYSARSTRRGFAPQPITLLKPALGITLQGDQYVLTWFDRGSKSKIHFNLNPEMGDEILNDDQRRDLIRSVLEQTRTGKPVITEGMTSHRIDDTPQDRQAGILREFQVQEIGRAYGIPAPLLGVDITQWGSGIEVLSKLFYRFGAKDHLMRFLAPLSLRLLRRGERFKPNEVELLRGDSEQISELIRAIGGNAQTPPVATREEQREIVGLPVDPMGEYVSIAEVESTPADGSGGEGDGESGEGDGGETAPPPARPPLPIPMEGRKSQARKCSKCERTIAHTTMAVQGLSIKCPRCNHVEMLNDD